MSRWGRWSEYLEKAESDRDRSNAGLRGHWEKGWVTHRQARANAKAAKDADDAAQAQFLFIVFLIVVGIGLIYTLIRFWYVWLSILGIIIAFFVLKFSLKWAWGYKIGKWIICCVPIVTVCCFMLHSRVATNRERRARMYRELQIARANVERAEREEREENERIFAEQQAAKERNDRLKREAQLRIAAERKANQERAEKEVREKERAERIGRIRTEIDEIIASLYVPRFVVKTNVVVNADGESVAQIERQPYKIPYPVRELVALMKNERYRSLFEKYSDEKMEAVCAAFLKEWRGAANEENESAKRKRVEDEYRKLQSEIGDVWQMGQTNSVEIIRERMQRMKVLKEQLSSDKTQKNCENDVRIRQAEVYEKYHKIVVDNLKERIETIE